MSNYILKQLPLAIVATALITSAAQAQQPYGGYGCGLGSMWYPGMWYNVYSTESIPYYQLHPPVYYSQPVPRAYGWSPFAYPPGVLTPEVVETAAPQVQANPFVPKSSVSEDDERVAGTQPLRITNPFAVDRIELTQSEPQFITRPLKAR